MSEPRRIQDTIQIEAAPGVDVLANAHDWHVGQININNIGQDWKSGLVVVLNPIPDASHTRNLKLSPPNSLCFPGTRKEVLKKIRSWIDSTLILNGRHILWIYGYAGCGKSAIAQAICNHYAEQGRLAAAFFFFRGSGGRSNISRFATTIAAQVAATIPETAPFIEAAIKANPGLLSPTTTSLSNQFDQLVYRPIDKAVRLAACLIRGPYIIVFDGVDECANHEEVADLIEHTISLFERKPYIPLRIVITSRVENHLHNRLYSSKQVKLLNLVQHTSDADILIALEAFISAERNDLVLACDESWPSSEDKARLVKHIGGSFIFFTTIMKLLFDPYADDGLTPMGRLPLILSIQPDFDEMYRAILKRSQTLPHFPDIITVVTLAQEPLTIAQIAELLNIQATEVATVLIRLNSIMQVPGDDRTPVTLWHTSLRDFLCSKGRAGQFFVNNHLTLAYGCIMLLVRSNNRPITSSYEYSRQFLRFHLEKILHSRNTEGVGQEAATLHTLAQFLLKLSQNNQPLLEIAIRSQDWKVVSALVDANADVNIPFSEPYNDTVYALYAVCYHGQQDLTHLLLGKGANPNAVGENGWSALHSCASGGHYDCARALLERKANPNIQDEYGRTPLHIAYQKGHDKIVDCLREFKADETIKNNDGRVAQYYSRK